MKTRSTLKIGDTASFKKKVLEQDIYDFAKVSGDFNPIHLDKLYAETSIFKERIAHGFLVGSYISAAIAQQLPGNGTIYLSQSLNFLAPVRINDEIMAVIEVVSFPKENRVLLKTTCENQEGTIVIEGKAVVIPPKGMKLIK